MEILGFNRHVSTVSTINAEKLHERQMEIYEWLLNRNKVNSFLKRMYTGGKKLISYDNVKRTWLVELR